MKKEIAMPRKYKSPERFLKPDPKYHDRLITKFINSMMYDGKKSLNERVLYDALAQVSDKAGEDALAGGLLALAHQVVDELGDHPVLELGVREDLALLYFAATRHRSVYP